MGKRVIILRYGEIFLKGKNRSYFESLLIKNIKYSLDKLLGEGKGYDCVFAVGPLAMMKAVCALTKKAGVATVVSMNSMMVDGTGMSPWRM